MPNGCTTVATLEGIGVRIALLAIGVSLLLPGLVPAAPESAKAVKRAKNGLADEFKGQQLRLRIDVLQWGPGDATITATATPDGVSYPNAAQPVAFEALSLVEVFGFWSRKDSVHIGIMLPGYNPQLFGSSVVSIFDPNPVSVGLRRAAKDAEMAAAYQYVLLKGPPERLREALSRVFYIDGETPSDSEVRGCLVRNAKMQLAVRASRCGVASDDAEALLRE